MRIPRRLTVSVAAVATLTSLAACSQGDDEHAAGPAVGLDRFYGQDLAFTPCAPPPSPETPKP
jgi:hypothetical protein